MPVYTSTAVHLVAHSQTVQVGEGSVVDRIHGVVIAVLGLVSVDGLVLLVGLPAVAVDL